MFLFFVLYLDLMPSAKKYGIQVQGYFWALLHGSPIKGVTPARAVAAAAKGFWVLRTPTPSPYRPVWMCVYLKPHSDCPNSPGDSFSPFTVSIALLNRLFQACIIIPV